MNKFFTEVVVCQFLQYILYIANQPFYTHERLMVL